MGVVLVTGSAGLIGSEAVKFFSQKGFDVVGIDNNMREYFFGAEAATTWNKDNLIKHVPNYTHYEIDIRDKSGLEKIFNQYANDILLVIHAAAQPSHDWATKEPLIDFSVNANGTLNLLDLTRIYSSEAVFIFTSTNKVYGDTPNRLPLIEQKTRWEISSEHKYFKNGIDETMSIDQNLHSLFGASKVAADVLVQEYGKYFGMKTACFRGGCLTGPAHSGTQLHGFLAYLVKCAVTSSPYKVLGYKGKQVRDNIHSYDLVNAFWHFYQNPRQGEVYNIGGGRFSNCSMLEAIEVVQKFTGKEFDYTYENINRTGDHVWWISDISKFCSHHPAWSLTYNINDIIREIYEALIERCKEKSYG